MELYISRFSQIDLHQDKELLIFSWLKHSQALGVPEVKNEIIKLLEYVDRHSIKNVIVDLSDYYVDENRELQSWINYKFMPMIMERSIRNYGFVMKSITKQYGDLGEETDHENLRVAYFPTVNDALEWIEI